VLMPGQHACLQGVELDRTRLGHQWLPSPAKEPERDLSYLRAFDLFRFTPA
jgi:hypothetical protein